jgi:hypothetical protein
MGWSLREVQRSSQDSFVIPPPITSSNKTENAGARRSLSFALRDDGQAINTNEVIFIYA